MPKQVLVAVGALFLAIAAWWLLRDDPEAQVHAAHIELAEVLSKPATGDDGLSVLQLRSLEAMFARQVVVSGDANGFSQTYTPEELVGLIVRIRAAFESVELGLNEIVVEIPASDAAVASFSSELAGVATSGEPVFEVRTVETHMHFVDGDWRFNEIALSEATSSPLPPR